MEREPVTAQHPSTVVIVSGVTRASRPIRAHRWSETSPSQIRRRIRRRLQTPSRRRSAGYSRDFRMAAVEQGEHPHRECRRGPPRTSRRDVSFEVSTSTLERAPERFVAQFPQRGSQRNNDRCTSAPVVVACRARGATPRGCSSAPKAYRGPRSLWLGPRSLPQWRS